MLADEECRWSGGGVWDAHLSACFISGISYIRDEKSVFEFPSGLIKTILTLTSGHDCKEQDALVEATGVDDQVDVHVMFRSEFVNTRFP